MTALKFNPSKNLSVGVELEVQIINSDNYDLAPYAKSFLNMTTGSLYEKNIKPEITQSMIEINSNPHTSVQTLSDELIKIRNFIVEKADELNFYFAGGGTHPFQLWNKRKIFHDPKFKQAANKYGYLAKQYTVFGLHIHIGCTSPEDMLYLLHSFPRYIPQLIALSASSPFCQGVDTDFDSSRSNVVSTFPLHGLSPIITDWKEFNIYISDLKNIAIIETIDNLYWDIRPRPEFGTVEIRVCDMPLSIHKVIQLTAYVQMLAYYILTERPTIPMSHNENHIYQYNKFQAGRFGFEGNYINPYTLTSLKIKQDILNTCSQMKTYINKFDSLEFITELCNTVTNERNDATLIRDVYYENESLIDIIKFQIQQFMEDDYSHNSVSQDNRVIPKLFTSN